MDQLHRPLYEAKGYAGEAQEKSFYVIHTETFGFKVSKRFLDAGEAYERVEELAKLNPSVTYYVLRAVSRVSTKTETKVTTVPLA